MIKYNLKCENKHEFESWFSDSKEFEKLSKKNFLSVFFATQKIFKNQSCPQGF